ncbi:MAG TPA: hypothetical protein VHY08_10775 [Bacillota bacterium]|nr:hypothetical protein [Bacillota bacterium]
MNGFELGGGDIEVVGEVADGNNQGMAWCDGIEIQDAKGQFVLEYFFVGRDAAKDAVPLGLIGWVHFFGPPSAPLLYHVLGNLTTRITDLADSRISRIETVLTRGLSL